MYCLSPPNWCPGSNGGNALFGIFFCELFLLWCPSHPPPPPSQSVHPLSSLPLFSFFSAGRRVCRPASFSFLFFFPFGLSIFNTDACVPLVSEQFLLGIFLPRISFFLCRGCYSQFSSSTFSFFLPHSPLSHPPASPSNKVKAFPPPFPPKNVLFHTSFGIPF